MKTVQHLWIAFGVWGFATGLNAQSVNWNNPGPVVPNSVAQLELVFTDCQPQGNVNLPQVNGLQVLGQPGRATSFSMINFQTSSSTTLGYSVQVGQGGRIQIPPFEVQTDKGKKTVPALVLDATASAPPPSRQRPRPFLSRRDFSRISRRREPPPWFRPAPCRPRRRRSRGIRSPERCLM